jgi:hypothetical protein
MKKNYIAPALYSVQVRAEQMIAASLSFGGKATDGEVLVKGSGDWDIFGDSDAGVDVESSDSPFED